jgi:hypothetical protein
LLMVVSSIPDIRCYLDWDQSSSIQV